MLRRTWLSRAGWSVAALSLKAQKLPDLYHDEVYGDPPYRSEAGWRALLNGKDLEGWRGLPGSPNEWFTTTAVHWHRVFEPARLEAASAPGDRIVNGTKGKTTNLVSEARFGSFELYLEFMTAKASNSGVYLHGLYEVQIFDSYGFDGPLTVGDCGGIYERADRTGGHPPLRNACGRPGQWQSLHIWFAAPRFDAAGHKTENARVRRVLLNDTLVQDNVALTGPTAGGMGIAEAPENPLMLQGDHSAIAYRALYLKAF
jgi:hypothetical protein